MFKQLRKLYEKIVIRISRRIWNSTVHHIIVEAMKRNIISSWSAHELLGAWNAECFPENGHASFLKKTICTCSRDDNIHEWTCAIEVVKRKEGTRLVV